MPHLYSCSACDFEFSNGHSHHARAFYLCCKACGVLGEIVHATSDWGPAIGEACRFHIRRKGKLKDTGIQLTYVYSHRFVDEQMKIDQEMGKFDLSPLICTHCKAQNSFVFDLQGGESCPRCHKGAVSVSGDVMY